MVLRFLLFCAASAPLLRLASAQNVRTFAVGGWASRTLERCEVDCGTRGPGFNACCPRGTVCLNRLTIPGYEDNTGCCPNSLDCSADLNTFDVCADASWKLYNHTGGFPFCCQSGDIGGEGRGGTYDACRVQGSFLTGEILLPVQTQGPRTVSGVSAPAPPPTALSSSTIISSSSSYASQGTGEPGTSTSSGAMETTATGAAAGATSGTTTASTQGEEELKSPKLAAGAIAGIVVGALFGLFLFGVGVWLCIGWRAERRQEGARAHLMLVGGISDDMLEVGGISQESVFAHR